MEDDLCDKRKDDNKAAAMLTCGDIGLSVQLASPPTFSSARQHIVDHTSIKLSWEGHIVFLYSSSTSESSDSLLY